MLSDTVTVVEDKNSGWMVIPRGKSLSISSTETKDDSRSSLSQVENSGYAVVGISNLANDVEIEDLKYLFNTIGPVIKAQIIGQGHAEIEMVNGQDAQTAMKQFNGMPLDGQPLKCELKSDLASPPPTLTAVNEHQKPLEQEEALTISLYKGFEPIPAVKIPDLNKDKGMIDLLVTEVFSPHKFFAILRDNYQDFEAFMFKLDDYYQGDNGLSQCYQLVEAKTKTGMNVAALYDKVWHRALLMSARFDKNKFNVFYIDYGSVATVPVSHVRYLDVRFTKYPCQGLQCRLSNVKPMHGQSEWPNESGEELLKIVQKIREGVVAKVDSIDKAHNIMYVTLYDTVTNDKPGGVNINKALIAIGHAAEDSKKFEPVDENVRFNYARSDIVPHKVSSFFPYFPI